MVAARVVGSRLAAGRQALFICDQVVNRPRGMDTSLLWMVWTLGAIGAVFSLVNTIWLPSAHCTGVFRDGAASLSTYTCLFPVSPCPPRLVAQIRAYTPPNATIAFHCAIDKSTTPPTAYNNEELIANLFPLIKLWVMLTGVDVAMWWWRETF